MSELFEILMILSFGASWPLNVIKSYKSRTAKGKSLIFLCLILFGYIAGIISKFLNESYMNTITSKWYVLFFYVLNLIMVGIDLCLYIRNRKLDIEAENEKYLWCLLRQLYLDEEDRNGSMFGQIVYEYTQKSWYNIISILI